MDDILAHVATTITGSNPLMVTAICLNLIPPFSSTSRGAHLRLSKSAAASSRTSLRLLLLLRPDPAVPTSDARDVVVAPSSIRRHGRGRRGGGPDRLHVHGADHHGLPPPRQRDPRPQGTPPRPSAKP
jgi:hypothetical protein